MDDVASYDSRPETQAHIDRLGDRCERLGIHVSWHPMVYSRRTVP